MTHRVHPYVFRVGEIRPWKSRWFNQKKFATYLMEDNQLREWLQPKLASSHIETLEIERSPNTLHIIIKTARPGILIGRGGEGAERLKDDIRKFIAKLWKRFNIEPERRDVKLTIEEIRSPETHAAIVGQMIVEDIQNRKPFRRVLKQTLEKISSAREVKGVKIVLKGRLDGAEMARYEWGKKGRIPLQTIRANIDYAEKTAFTTYGTIGIKVWIYKGDVFAVKSEDQK